MTEPVESTVPPGPPPVTGHHDIDRALAALALGHDVGEHPERIAAVLDTIQRALSSPALPDALRPR